jgi:hypothetical protein
MKVRQTESDEVNALLLVDIGWDGQDLAPQKCIDGIGAGPRRANERKLKELPTCTYWLERRRPQTVELPATERKSPMRTESRTGALLMEPVANRPTTERWKGCFSGGRNCRDAYCFRAQYSPID